MAIMSLQCLRLYRTYTLASKVRRTQQGDEAAAWEMEWRARAAPQRVLFPSVPFPSRSVSFSTCYHPVVLVLVVVVTVSRKKVAVTDHFAVADGKFVVKHGISIPTFGV